MSTRTISIIVTVTLVVAGIIAFLSSRRTANEENSLPVQIKWYGLNEGMELAQQQNKKVLIDVYADWCVWCKKMDEEVYKDKNIGSALASNFIAVKLNAESSKLLTFNGDQTDEATFARAIGITSYPTTVFLEAGAKPITKVAGYLEPREFGSVLKYIGEDYYKTRTYDKFKSEIQINPDKSAN